MILTMVRHGETHFNAQHRIQGRIDNPLNQKGREQARFLAMQLKLENAKYDTIASSPLSRALETAYIIAKKLDYDKPIELVQNFVERDFFHLDGQSVEIAMPLVRSKNYRYEGYEDDEKLINRIVPETLKFAQKHENQNVLCVVHSHVIKALMVHCNPEKFSFADYFLSNADVVRFQVENQKITFIEHKHYK